MSARVLPKTQIISVDGVLPVDLQSARQKLGEASNDLDTEILDSLEAATCYCEEACGRTLRATSTIVEAYPCWPTWAYGFTRNPVLTVESISYFPPGSDALTLLDFTVYRLVQSSTLGSLIEFVDRSSLPAVDDRIDAIQVSYTAGYGSEPVDPRGKQAILLKLPLFFGDTDSRDFANTDKMANSLLAQLQWQLYQ